MMRCMYDLLCFHLDDQSSTHSRDLAQDGTSVDIYQSSLQVSLRISLSHTSCLAGLTLYPKNDFNARGFDFVGFHNNPMIEPPWTS